MTASSAPIETVELTKRYGRITALAGLSMRVEAGSVFGFLGPNGAGKTTAVKLLLGLARPTSGDAVVLGAPVSDEPAHRAARRRVGYLPELFRYPGWLSAREVLAVHCELARLERPWGSQIDAALRTVGLAERAGDRVEGFSKGMQQRLGLAVALLGSPEVVVLDEPTSALDPVGRHDVREILRSLRARGTTVFLNSHLLSEVEQVCDRVAVVDHGKVVAQGTLAELLRSDSVRVRAADVSVDVRAEAARQGFALEGDGDRLVAHGVDIERVPLLVGTLVRGGARVYSVEPVQQTLEDRFLQILGERH
ncbi:MAG: ABC transporter ATP-binding protein [Chloroflexota bacterium]|nr:ABC transporter ATP-binding protein [Chloroflexota bacterium]